MKLSNRQGRGIYFRNVQNSRYKTFCTAIVDDIDKTLSWTDVGIWYFVKSRGPGWELHMNDLVRRKLEGEWAITMSLKRLRKAGYCQLVQVRRAGIIVAWRYDFFDIPLATPQTKHIIENYDAKGKLIEATSPDRGLPEVGKPRSGKLPRQERGFPGVEKPRSGNGAASPKNNNDMGESNGDAISKDISYPLIILEQDIKERNIDNNYIHEEIDFIKSAVDWWEKAGAETFKTARGFAARELGRAELVAIGEQLRAMGDDELLKRYAAYHRLTDKTVEHFGFNIWGFIKNLDKLGMLVNKKSGASNGVPAPANETEEERFKRKFCVGARV